MRVQEGDREEKRQGESEILHRPRKRFSRSPAGLCCYSALLCSDMSRDFGSWWDAIEVVDHQEELDHQTGPRFSSEVSHDWLAPPVLGHFTCSSHPKDPSHTHIEMKAWQWNKMIVLYSHMTNG